LAELRQHAYHLFGSLLLYPDAERSGSFPAMAETLAQGTRSFSRFAFWDQWDRFLATLRGLSHPERASLEAEYIRTFTVASDAQPSLAYESAYMEPQDAGWVMAELDREYAAAGFSLTPEFKEPPDHVSSELEFMSLLCGEEALTWKQKALDHALKQLELEASFLKHHLCGWFPLFSRQVARVDRSGFYTIATDVAQAFIEHDKELLAVLIQRFQRAEAGVVGC
jgi:TorA maturation chaperone TorD